MAALTTLVLVTITFGVLLGAYLKICFAIRRDDRTKWSLRRGAPNRSAQNAREFVGITISGSKRE